MKRDRCNNDVDCLNKARRKCDCDPKCFGIAWHKANNNLKFCRSNEMKTKKDGWRTMMKQSSGEFTKSLH